MKRTTYYCDICASEMGSSNAETGYLAKRLRTEVGVNATEVEVSVIVTGWCGKKDICHRCGKEALEQTKRKLAFSIVGED